MVKLVLMYVAQASYALVPARICVTTGNGHKVSSIVKVSFTKFSYGHERHLYTLTQRPISLGPENYNKTMQQKYIVLNVLCFFFFIREIAVI